MLSIFSFFRLAYFCTAPFGKQIENKVEKSLKKVFSHISDSWNGVEDFFYGDHSFIARLSLNEIKKMVHKKKKFSCRRSECNWTRRAIKLFMSHEAGWMEGNVYNDFCDCRDKECVRGRNFNWNVIKVWISKNSLWNWLQKPLKFSKFSLNCVNPAVLE